jgi:argininosuccinate lyase
MTRLWDRGEPLDAAVLGYTAGDDATLDDRLVAHDVRASAAHVEMLRAAGHLSEADRTALVEALDEIGASHARGEWRVALDEEDAHTALENRLTARLGEAGRRIHLGRSRNDQVLAALRLWMKAELETLAQDAESVASALDALSEPYAELPMPGYTHMQRAMPTTFGLWAGAFAAEIRDDAEGVRAAARRADRNPLGSGAGYGVPVVRIDRVATARALGFGSVHEPVTAVQLSRGKAEASALFEAALFAQDLGRLAADLVLFATAEFGFVRLPVEATTGSSMLPQKRNPDVLEIARGRTAEAIAALHEVMGVTMKLTSGYHRDLQLIKKPLFRGIDSVRETARVMARLLPGIQLDAARLEEAVDPSLRAAEHAYRLVVEEGISFREAYARVRASLPGRCASS